LFTFKEAGTEVSPVTMSCPSPITAAPWCLPLDIENPLNEDMRLFALVFFVLCDFELLAFGFLDTGDFWKGKC
jgi:hypothetical protein